MFFSPDPAGFFVTTVIDALLGPGEDGTFKAEAPQEAQEKLPGGGVLSGVLPSVVLPGWRPDTPRAALPELQQ